MQRRARTLQENGGTARVKQEKEKVKEKAKGKRSRQEEIEPIPSQGTYVQDETNDDDEDQEADEPESPRGSKRQRTNDEGDSTPSGSGSQEPRRQVKTLPRGKDGYIPGSIVRIKLTNFVTYDLVEFTPGSHLNMIVGPNGTGKSSISCAIVLGLNFDPKILGRATDLHAYVKHGASSATIEIELKARDEKPNLVIRRVINASGKGSSFTLNGHSASGKEINNKVAELNVQVGNLCSFLPQDKVSEFARMTPQELLKETQRAAGDENLTNWHNTLIHTGKEQRVLQQTIKEEENSLQQMRDRNENIEHEVKRFHERKQIQHDIALLKVLVPVAEYREVRTRFRETKNLQRKLHRKVIRLKEKNAPAHTLLKKYETDQKAAEEEREKLKRSTQAKFKGLLEKDKENEELEKDSDAVLQNLADLKGREQARQRQMMNFEREIESQRKFMEDHPPPDPADDQALSDEIKILRLGRHAAEAKDNELQAEMQNLHNQKAKASREQKVAENQLQQLMNTDNLKLEKVKQLDQTTYDAILWLRNNKNLFKMEVFETPIMRMDIKDQRYTQAIEGCFNYNQLKTFITQCQEDCDTLNKYVNDDHVLGEGKKITTWYRPYQENVLLDPPMSPEEMRDMGFDGYALDYIECPREMHWFLMRDLSLHRTAISLKGVRDVNAAMELVARPGHNHSGGATFINVTSHNNVSRSRYGKRAVGNMTRELNSPKSFTIAMVDPAAKHRFDQEIARCKGEVALCEDALIAARAQDEANQKSLAASGNEIKVLLEKRDTITQQQTQIVKAQSKLDAAKKGLKKLKAEKPLDEKRKEYMAQLKGLNAKRVKIAKKYTDLVHAIIYEQEQCTKAALKCLQISANKEALKELCERKDQKYNAALKEFIKADNDFREIKAESKDILNRSRDVLHDSPKPVQDAFANLEEKRLKYEEDLKEATEKGLPPPDDSELENRSSDALEAELQTQEARLEMLMNTNPGVVEQYEKRKKDIEQLERTLVTRRKDEEKISKNIKNARDNWQPALERLVNSIGQKFSAAFDRIGCAGEIRISEDEDYEKWAIDILVKFRDSERLQLLTAHRQSGGERSLTTILYLMSLTEEARAPFSLVDEINQGMDQRAERVVHNSMVNVTCQPDSAQYFLITPKLLPDLEYHDRMKILCVNNGEWLPEHGNLGKMSSMIDAYEAAQRQKRAGSSHNVA